MIAVWLLFIPLEKKLLLFLRFFSLEKSPKSLITVLVTTYWSGLALASGGAVYSFWFDCNGSMQWHIFFKQKTLLTSSNFPTTEDDTCFCGKLTLKNQSIIKCKLKFKFYVCERILFDVIPILAFVAPRNPTFFLNLLTNRL